ncbi:uncharacterized protein LOC130553787 isoform X3 [Triplophysa rosa]|uniref:uncharacterized protein LOC130553787 isoform X3 n=1 Tax=Triplophysa rosa TaxID=992332 RepID=UPI002545FAF7|nr:uncharacterized protein LOC130553787 isoform X3 [Triplophysa rosa]
MLKLQSGAVRAVMDMSLFVLLLLSGLLCSASGFQREYYYVNTKMSWSDAQRYCRENYNYLATVDSMNDVNKMMNTVNDGYSGSVWIGLKRPTQRSWAWSMGNETLTEYSAWWGSQPSGGGDCVFFVYTAWYDYSCATNLDFVCYDALRSRTRYVLSLEIRDGSGSVCLLTLGSGLINGVSPLQTGQRDNHLHLVTVLPCQQLTLENGFKTAVFFSIHLSATKRPSLLKNRLSDFIFPMMEKTV